MRRAINGAHPATAEAFIQSILPIEDPTEQGIELHICKSGVGLQRRVVAWTHQHVAGKLPAASWALKHIDD